VAGQLGQAYVTIAGKMDKLRKSLKKAKAVTAKEMAITSGLVSTSYAKAGDAIVVSMKKTTEKVNASTRKVVAPAKHSARLMRKAFTASFAMIRRGVNRTASVIVMKLGGAIRSVTSFMKRWIRYGLMAASAAMIYATKTAIDFEKQLAQVSTMLGAESMHLMASYRTEIRNISKQFGDSTASLTAGLYDLLSAGIDASEAPKVLAAASKMATAGMTDTKTAVSALLDVLNAYQMDTSRVVEVSDKLFTSVFRGRLTFDQLAAKLGSVTATAHAAGLSLEQLLAAVSTITRGGVKPDQAFTAITGAINSFIKPTKEAKKEAEKHGVVLDSNTLKTKGLVGAVADLNKLSADQIAILFPNIRAFRGMAAAMQDVAGFQKDLTMLTLDYAGRTQIAFDKIASTVGFKATLAWKNLKDAGRELADKVLLPLMDNYLPGIIAKFEEWGAWIDSNHETLYGWAEILKTKIDTVYTKVDGFIKLLTTDLSAAWVLVTQVTAYALAGLAALAVVWGKYIGKELAVALSSEFSAELRKEIARLFMANPITGKTLPGFSWMTENIDRQSRESKRERKRQSQGGKAPIQVAGRDSYRLLQEISNGIQTIVNNGIPEKVAVGGQ